MHLEHAPRVVFHARACHKSVFVPPDSGKKRAGRAGQDSSRPARLHEWNGTTLRRQDRGTCDSIYAYPAAPSRRLPHEFAPVPQDPSQGGLRCARRGGPPFCSGPAPARPAASGPHEDLGGTAARIGAGLAHARPGSGQPRRRGRARLREPGAPAVWIMPSFCTPGRVCDRKLPAGGTLVWPGAQARRGRVFCGAGHPYALERFLTLVTSTTRRSNITFTTIR